MQNGLEKTSIRYIKAIQGLVPQGEELMSHENKKDGDRGNTLRKATEPVKKERSHKCYEKSCHR